MAYRAPVTNDAAFTSGQIITADDNLSSVHSVSAIPNGITATTQSAGDNTTKVATDAFVHTEVANAIAGVNPAVAVQAATTAAANTSGFTYNNGVGGIGATFTGSVNTAVTIDGFTFSALGQRLLVKNDTQSPSGAFNGVYYVTQLQTALLAPILTRALDYDSSSDINNTGAIPVVNGTVNALTSWLLTSTVNTVGTDPLTYSQFQVNPTAPYIIVSAKQASLSGNVTTTSTTYVMGGAKATYTPVRSGAIMGFATAQISNDTKADTVVAYIAYGTGTAPNSGAAASGSTLAGVQSVVNPNLAGVGGGFYPSAWAGFANLSVGTAYWFDFAFLIIGAGSTSQVNNFNIQIVEF